MSDFVFSAAERAHIIRTEIDLIYQQRYGLLFKFWKEKKFTCMSRAAPEPAVNPVGRPRKF